MRVLSAGGACALFRTLGSISGVSGVTLRLSLGLGLEGSNLSVYPDLEDFFRRMRTHFTPSAPQSFMSMDL